MGDVVPALEGRKSQIPAGTRLGRYRVVRRIAAGGMAEVYLARAEGPGGFAKAVALKLVLPHLSEQPQFRLLFEQEARIAAYLNHPNIVQIFELGAEAGDVFIAMEFVDGRTLQSLLGSARGPLPLACALSILAATCTALHHAHNAKDGSGRPLSLVHRDISPSNVMVRHDGQVKVVDFGIAKARTETALTRTGSLKGKAGYMSPEQCRGVQLTRASDIFNLGILLFEMTTGTRAFGGANLFEAMNRIVDGRYRPPRRIVPDYPPALESIVRKAMSVDPAGRYPTALALREAVEAFATAQRVTLSELPVAEWMGEMFGPPTSVDVGVATLPTFDRASRRGRSRIPIWLQATIVGGLAGTAVFFALGSAGPGTATPDPALPKAAVAGAAPESAAPKPASRAPTTKPPDPVRPHPSGAPVVAAPTLAPKPAAIPEVVPGAAPAEAAPPSGANKRKRKRRRSKRKKSKPKKKNDDPLFPWRDQ